MINFNLFVLPFSLGLIYMLLAIATQWYRWIGSLPATDRMRFRAGMKHPTLIFSAIGEVIMEGLLHRRMWKRNPMLGYMHMSFALGWFLLIVFGNIESRYYSGTHLNAPYYPIFLKFFIHDRLVLFFEVDTVPGFFRFAMDFLLLYVLSGLILALFKRRRSRLFGMERTTVHDLNDRVAMASLWLIFPMRLLAESFTAGYYGSGGGFMTQPLGNFLAGLNPFSAEITAYTMWWSYSLVLGIFFVTLPNSRYMHIPTEILLIFFRHFGLQPKRWYSGFADTEVHSCSRCGVCIDVCQMNAAGIHDAQSVYFLRGVRDRYVPEVLARQCLVCGRCQSVCPVGIGLDPLRLVKRRELVSGQKSDFAYLAGHPVGVHHPVGVPTADVVYFAGCMSHLTPAIIRAMTTILKRAGVSFVHIDAERSICCGRPLMVAGKDRQAGELIEYNKALFRKTKAKILVTSCPICYRVFREEYNLQILVRHHSQYLNDLLRNGKIPLQSVVKKAVYHDPCDLGRGSRVYDPPRELLAKVADLSPVSQERKDALCCGGSLAMFEATQQQRDAMTDAALGILEEGRPEVIATACPLCKNTLEKRSGIPVKDIAELIYDAMPADSSDSASGRFRQAVSSGSVAI